MKRLLFVSLLLLAGLLFAQGGQGNLTRALNQLEETSKSIMLVSVVIEGVLAVVFLGGAAAVYLYKIKGKPQSALWIVLAALLGLIGAGFVLGVIVGLITYLAAPAITSQLMNPG